MARNLTPEQKLKNAERSRKWREVHPDYMKGYMKPYREKNGDKMREADRIYHAEHREERNAVRRQWAKDNPEKDREATARWRAENPDRVHDSYLKRTYGITLDQYRAQMEKQGHACAICKKKFEKEFDRSIHVDHDHKTGQFRGLLCQEHNTMLGLAQEDVQILLSAIAYLRSPFLEPEAGSQGVASLECQNIPPAGLSSQ